MKTMIRVFSIEEFSVYDGPGIRTTVFLKGCPLRCSWCHSPEGQEFKNVALRSPNGCLNCNKCIDICENKRKNCIACQKCLDVCPQNLIRMAAIDYEIEKLNEILLKNINILNMNGGGITFSGGEPLLQHEALNLLIDKLKGQTHLSIQTSGYAAQEDFKKIISKLDLVLFDMKIMDKELAYQYEGIDNQVILDNLEILKNSQIPFIIRIPLIPGIIDTKENIMEIITKIKGAKNLKMVELLPYNKYAGSKYKLAGKKYEPNFDESVESNPHLELFLDAKIQVRVL